MAKSTIEFHVTVKRSWWLRCIYIPGVVLFSRTVIFFGGSPQLNTERIRFWIRKGLKVEVSRPIFKSKNQINATGAR